MYSLENYSSMNRSTDLTLNVCRLPREIWLFIFKCLHSEDLQELLYVNYGMKQFVLSLPLFKKMFFPSSRPDHSEIEIKMTKTLVLDSRMFRYDWGVHVLGYFSNVKILEVETKNPTKKGIKGIHTAVQIFENIKELVVSYGEIKKWQLVVCDSVRVSFFATSHPLLKDVANDPITVPQNYHFAQLITKLNTYKENALKQFSYNGKFNNPAETLSINGIMIVGCEYVEQYGFNIEYWEAIVQEHIDNITKGNTILNVDEDIIAANVTEASKTAKKSLGSAANLLQAIKEKNTYSDNVKRCHQMLENLLKLVPKLGYWHFKGDIFLLSK